MQPHPIELLCLLHLLVFPGFIADSEGKHDPAFLTAGAIIIFGSNLMFLRKLTGRKDSSEENLALDIESFELFVNARERCFECRRSWQEVPQVVKGVIRQSSDHSVNLFSSWKRWRLGKTSMDK